MDTISVKSKGDVLDFGFYIKSRPGIKFKIDNTDFKAFCENTANQLIKYDITTAPGIYAFKKKQTNKVVYVGQAVNLKARISQHSNSAFNPNIRAYNTRLASAFRKYGPQAFELEILAILDNLDYEELDHLEREYIKK